MKAGYSDIHNLLAAHGLLPENTLAVYLCGSMARGWGNARSDIDLVVVVPAAWQSPTAGELRVALDPGAVPFETLQVQGQQLEAKYWLEHQILQVVEKVSWHAVRGAHAVHERLTPVEENLLGRLLTCIPISGESWIDGMRERIRESAFTTIALNRTLELVQEAVDDARGQLEAEDIYSAVLSTRIAFGHSVDALTLSRGELDRSTKWRARRVHEVAAAELPFGRYWDIETMRDLNALGATEWTSSVLDLCESLTDAVKNPNQPK